MTEEVITLSKTELDRPHIGYSIHHRSPADTSTGGTAT